jgi:hypothetical protein
MTSCNTPGARLPIALCTLFLLSGVLSAAEPREGMPLKQGDAITIDGHHAVLTTLDTLPYVDDQYTRRFKFDSFDNSKLTELRQRYHLDEVVAPGKDEFDRQVLLVDWVNHRFKKFGAPSAPVHGALEILPAVDSGGCFFCTQYGEVMISAAASLGWVDRPLALRRPDNRGSGSTEHTSTEIWSNQYRKWVVLDPTFAMYFEKDGIPLSAYEFRQEWFYHDAKDVTFVLDKDRKRYHKSDMPVLRGRYPGFGDLMLDPGATNVYAFIGYVPNTNLLDAGPDYGAMFITKDAICDGTQWHNRQNPADPAHDPYFPIDQAAVALVAEGPSIHVSIKTLTPNFKTFLARLDGQDWKPAPDHLIWLPHPGTSRLEVKAQNQFGVEGPVSTAVFECPANSR